MKIFRSSLITLLVLLSVRCNTTKTAKTKQGEVTPVAAVRKDEGMITPEFSPALFSHGIYPPRNEELVAIQKQYADATMETLKAGHVLYTVGACTGCHGPQSIYKYSESQWKTIMDDMALKAQISAAEKDAVYKYVLAIKATQPNGTK